MHKINCLLLKKASWKPCPFNEHDSSYNMLPYVQILIKTTDSWGYLGSTVRGGYVAKPPWTL